LGVCQVIPLLQAHLGVGRRAGTNSSAAQGARAGADCRTPAAADCSAKSRTQHRADNGRSDLLVVRLLCPAGYLILSELLAQQLI
jgi:hypothetical protein